MMSVMDHNHPGLISLLHVTFIVTQDSILTKLFPTRNTKQYRFLLFMLSTESEAACHHG